MVDDTWLTSAFIAPEVAALRPDYRCVLVTATELRPGPGDAVSDALLTAAEDVAQVALATSPADQLPHIAAWREAFRAFGAKPQRTRNSAEALVRRVGRGVPRIDRLTDTYNAVSIRLQVPVGGENLAAYRGPLRLVRATGEEEFPTLASGAEVVEHPEPGEVVWRDDLGVTCRRWNWRQCDRTRLDGETTEAVFIGDVLDVEPGDGAARAAAVREALLQALEHVSPGATLDSRVLLAADAR